MLQTNIVMFVCYHRYVGLCIFHWYFTR